MARRLSSDELMVNGDWLMVDGKQCEQVMGFAGKRAGKFEKSKEYPGKKWVEEGPRNITEICNNLVSGLERIRVQMWKEN